MRLGSAIVALAVMAAPAWADGDDVPIAELTTDCSAVVTIQFEDCSVATLARCVDGHTMLLDGDLVSEGASRFDPDGDLVYSIDGEGYGILRVIEVRDAFSYARLAATGLETYDATVEWRYIFPHPRPSTLRSTLTLDGGTVEIDGRMLRTGHAEIITVYGMNGPTMTSRGNVLFDPDLGLLVRDSVTEEFLGVTLGPLQAAPVSFAFPGESGFMSKTPTTGCTAPTS